MRGWTSDDDTRLAIRAQVLTGARLVICYTHEPGVWPRGRAGVATRRHLTGNPPLRRRPWREHGDAIRRSTLARRSHATSVVLGTTPGTTNSRVVPKAGATGLEPATSGVTGRRSNQLSYAPSGRGSMARVARGCFLAARRLKRRRGGGRSWTSRPARGAGASGSRTRRGEAAGRVSRRGRAGRRKPPGTD